MGFDLFSQPAFQRPFSGSNYVPLNDEKRLTGQLLRVYELLKEGRWLTLGELESELNARHPGHHHPAASLSAQIRNLRKNQFGNHTIEKRHRGDRNQGLWEYKLTQ